MGAVGDKPQEGYLGVGLIFPEAGVKGAEISDADFDGPAFKAGIHDGIITVIDGLAVSDPDMLITTIRGLPPGKTVELSVLRDGKLSKFSVRLDERLQKPQALVKAATGQKPPKGNAAALDDDVASVVSGDMTGYGTHIVSSPGKFVVGGRYEISKDANLLYIAIDRLTNRICIDVHDEVILAGTLRVRPPVGKPKVPFQAGDRFVLIRSGKSIKGTFKRVDLPELAAGLRWRLVYDDVVSDSHPKSPGKPAVTITVLGENVRKP